MRVARSHVLVGSFLQKVITEFEPKVLRIESRKGFLIVVIEKVVREAIIIREVKALDQVLKKP